MTNYCRPTFETYIITCNAVYSQQSAVLTYLEIQVVENVILVLAEEVSLAILVPEGIV
jgi:hypothetical protein